MKAARSCPDLIEWPARIPQPRTTRFRASTSDLLPTLCALTGQPLPARPIDGIDLTPVLDGKMTSAPSRSVSGIYNTDRFAGVEAAALHRSPAAGRAPRRSSNSRAAKPPAIFTNFRHPAAQRQPTTSAPAPSSTATSSSSSTKQRKATPGCELFDLQADPAETNNLIEQQPAVAQKLQSQLRDWQDSVLQSLTGGGLRKLKQAAPRTGRSPSPTTAAGTRRCRKQSVNQLPAGPHARPMVERDWSATPSR